MFNKQKNKKYTKQGYNKYRIPYFVVVLLLIILLPIGVMASSVSNTELIELTNNIRKESGLNELAPNSKLTQAAYNKAKNILDIGYFAHTTPEGKRFYEWIDGQNYNYLYAGENLAIDFLESESVVNAWMESKLHRENILNPKYKDIGIVVLRGQWKDRETTIVVQLFGSTIDNNNQILGQTFEPEDTKKEANKIVKDIIILPSLAGENYFDIITNVDKKINLAITNSSAAEVSSTPRIKIALGEKYNTLLKTDNNCCRENILFTLSSASDNSTFFETTPVIYPKVGELIKKINIKKIGLNSLPDSPPYNIYLALLAIVLLFVSFKDEIMIYYRKNIL